MKVEVFRHALADNVLVGSYSTITNQGGLVSSTYSNFPKFPVTLFDLIILKLKQTGFKIGFCFIKMLIYFQTVKTCSGSSLFSQTFIRKLWILSVIILSFRIDRYGQTEQTQIRLHLEEQSAPGLHCLLFHFAPF